MAANKRIQTSELDFDRIKANLKAYLQGQEQFQDYDFEGSGMSVLLDVLAYNTHYNALYTNLAVNESFLDSASKRDSVVSKARELGYIPTSFRAAIGKVTVTFINDAIGISGSLVELPVGTMFFVRTADKTFSFASTKTYIGAYVGNTCVFQDVEVREGTSLVYEWTVSQGQRFILPNAGVDTSTIQCFVQENNQTAIAETFVEANSILDVSGTSAVYFLKEIENGLYEMEFGNGIVGKALSEGNVVRVRYTACNGSAANGARNFTFGGSVPSGAKVFVATTDIARGGSDAESIDSIKWNAPRIYAAQNRCVSLDDYRAVIMSEFPNASSVNVWGGESNNPPSYGDVFISVQPTTSDILSNVEKEHILNDIIGPRRVVTVHPKIVDPVHLHVGLDVTFYFDPTESAMGANDLVASVTDTILNFNSKYLNRFDSILKYSTLLREIDETHPAITNSIVTLKMHRDVPVSYNSTAQYVIDIGNPIYNSGVPEESILTSGFSIINLPYTVYIDDVPVENSNTGQLRLFYYANGQKNILNTIGTVNYATGLITVNDLIITGLASTNWMFTIKGQSNDIASVRNQVVNINTDFLSVRAKIDTVADKYNFTSSRN